jgi:hypothetical protein
LRLKPQIVDHNWRVLLHSHASGTAQKLPEASPIGFVRGGENGEG